MRLWSVGELERIPVVREKSRIALPAAISAIEVLFIMDCHTMIEWRCECIWMSMTHELVSRDHRDVNLYYFI